MDLSTSTVLVTGANRGFGRALTNALRVQLADQDILVAGLHVGYMDTDMTAGVTAHKSDPTDIARIAAIRGRTRGAGNELALACDLRYASREKAFFGQPEVGIGIVPGGGGTERLPRPIGRDRALEAILGSADYDADVAERWGWVTRALPDAELDAFVDATVARLASFDRQALATAKAMVNRATLPPDADLVTRYGEFVDSLTNPGYLVRAAALGALVADKGLDVEYHLGEYLGLANQTT
ncbi:enoyl-CoA hydratase-related protein [Saccharothrix deserti]|uniref:enoyl-CoA hydratase-related protein n=1 Tax=Saccharothrix deserti TaxID=2593674 RepID=UPI001EE48FA1|nr:enoyl-CoA hydratase-related protein [Saccharothrix deserti]